jgi:hypothetical protein
LAATVAAVLSLNMGGAGLGSAHAVVTTLCKAPQETCEVANRVASGTILAMSSTQVNFLNTISNVSCTSSAFKAVTEGVTGEPLPAKISTANAPTYGGCKTASGTNCTVTAVNAPYNVKIAWVFANSGTFTVESGGAGAPGVDVKCGLIIDCRFRGTVAYTMKGGNPASIEVTGAALEAEGLVCPKEVAYGAAYGVDSPKPLYVAHT